MNTKTHIGAVYTNQNGRGLVLPTSFLPSLLLLTLLLGTSHATTTLTATPNPYTLTNRTIDVGFISIANTVISNGAGTYTGNWLWVSPGGNALTLSNTLKQNLPASLCLSLTINAISYNSLLLTFNGVSYYANAVYPNSIYGTWTFNAFAGDTMGIQAQALHLLTRLQ